VDLTEEVVEGDELVAIGEEAAGGVLGRVDQRVRGVGRSVLTV
jgi:hypothetical protein